MYRFSSVSRTVRTFVLIAGLAAMLPAGRGASGQAYKQPNVVATGNWPRNFIAANLNGKPGFVYFSDVPTSYDGIAYTAQDSMELEQDANGKFLSSAGTFGGVCSSLKVASGNFLGHGFEDLIFAETQPFTSSGVTPQTIAVDFEVANGDGTYGGVGEGANFVAQGAALPVVGAMVVGDFNGDGYADLAVLDSANGYVYILLNNQGSPQSGSGGILTLVDNIKLANGGSSLIAGKLFGGKNTDLAILAKAPMSVTTLRGNGDGTFGVGDEGSLPGGIFSMLYADVNGDGFPDLVAEGVGGALSVFPGSATGFATTPTALTGAQDGVHGSGGHLIGIADLNGDGIADIVVSTPAGVTVLLGQGSLSYKAGPSYNAGPGRSSYALADFNGDGKLDLAVDSPEGIAILNGDGKGGFDVGVTANAGQPVYSMALGDFTGSGKTDVAAATGVPQVQMMKGDGTGNFVALGSAAPAGAAETNAGRTVWSHVVAGDFDRDGKQDLVVALDGPLSVDLGPCCAYPASDDGMSILFGHGDGTFEAPEALVPFANEPNYGEIAEADIYGANVPSIVVFDLGSVVGYLGGQGAFPGGGIAFYFGSYADGKQHPYGQFALGQFTRGRAVGPDMVQQFPSSTGANFSAVANYGYGSFTVIPMTLAVPAGYVVPDLATSTLPAAGMYVSAMALQDLDGDGYADLEVLYHNLAADPANPSATTPNLLYIFWGNGVGATGDGTFDPTPEIATLSRNFYEMAVADVDGDGKPDFVLSDGYVVSVLSGNGTRVGFKSETHYLAGMGINGLAVQDVNGDGKLEILAANGGAVLSSGVVNGGVLAANAEVNTGGLTVLGGTAGGMTLGSVTGTVVASPEPSVYGTDITLTATLAAPAVGVAPSGSVAFSIDGTLVGTETVTNGVASYTVMGTTIAADLTNPIYWVGPHVLTAVYSGDTSYATATLTGSHTVAGQATIASIQKLDTSIFYGQEIGYDNGIDANLAIGPASTNDVGGLDGTILVYIDGTLVCTSDVGSGGRCDDPPFENFPVGTHMIYETYSGNHYYAPSMSPIYDVVISADPTTATVTSSLNPSTLGQAVTFQATIGDQYAVAQGTVNFLDGTTVIGSGTVNGQGQATFTTSSLALGVHPINVMYEPGSANFLASSGTLLNGQTVNAVIVPPPPPPPPPPPTGTFTLAVNPAALSIGVGNSLTAQVVVTALNGYSQPVQLGCSGLPYETTCTFTQSLIGFGGGTVGMIVSPAAPHNCGSSTPDFVAPNVKSGMVGLALGGLALLGLRRRRRVVKALALLVCFGLLPMLGGCGSGCKDFGTEPTNYTFTVTATSVGTPVTVLTQVVKLRVHL